MEQGRKSRAWSSIARRFRSSAERLRITDEKNSRKSDASTINPSIITPSTISPSSPDKQEESSVNTPNDHCRYSSSIYSRDDKEASDVQSVLLPPSPADETVDPMMTTSARHTHPYRVSDSEWIPASEDPSTPRASVVLGTEGLDRMERSAHLRPVLKIFIQLFAVAKILHVAFLAYGVETDENYPGLAYWIKCAEAEVRTDSLETLIQIVENLYYVLYSRIILEMSAIELCAQFKMEPRPRSNGHQFYLPDPNHMYRVFLAMKDLLDSPNVCAQRHEAVEHRYQEDYIRRLWQKETNRGFNNDDLLGFRRFAMNIVNERTCEFTLKWTALLPFFSEIPAELLALISEKYFAMVPKAVPENDVPTTALPFIHMKAADYALWEKDIIKDHRIATLAKLEGESVGDERRKDPTCHLLHLAKQRKCICHAICYCARECTYNVERACPCAERQLRVALSYYRKGPGRYKFEARVDTLGWACFQGLASLQRNVEDEEMTKELCRAMRLFESEITKERSPIPNFSRS
ncbi:hypothetical protein N7532_004437 [Penicillium argentinense]|uniref:Uncharacterized protein n=1 Tax=Penicillium argentinense TaxID=1131581 RepID=A0A9W9FPG7_9EURO|nr:uncharacterized protein N7532_004437 [Penicillium argentinense]KAJ5103908.1 hypothetical protein N7532_004437 [Penicillium argentinense]